ncbi:MAG: methylated-DNA--[protein]-cysteine S-methyltransferase [Desulfovibrionaceae bacterium]|nr:methylated-DNA--[protein]-cysteine S-methyltransferase [Desulfovibrionaceae bacterium]
MLHTAHYPSPLGDILLAADSEGLTGLWFEGHRHFGRGLSADARDQEIPLLRDAKRWLDIYFSGREPDFAVPVHSAGTPFQLAVWRILLAIPYGRTMTYGEIAREFEKGEDGPRMAAQAVGGAVGRNPVSIFVPCHRVVGANGSLTGYGGGIGRKARLLELEGADMRRLFVPKKGTAL